MSRLSFSLLDENRLHSAFKDLQLSDEQKKNYTLAEIEKLLQVNGYSLRQYHSMPQPDIALLNESNNRMIQEELQYDIQELSSEHLQLLSTMTDEQHKVYDEIMTAVSMDIGGVYFLYGYGGTGKTYLWRALSSAIRSKGDVVVIVASSGIDALLILEVEQLIQGSIFHWMQTKALAVQFMQIALWLNF